MEKSSKKVKRACSLIRYSRVPMSDSVPFWQIYLPTQKSDVIYGQPLGSSRSKDYKKLQAIKVCAVRESNPDRPKSSNLLYKIAFKM